VPPAYTNLSSIWLGWWLSISQDGLCTV